VSDENKIPLPPVQIAADAPTVVRRYLVLEIRGGDEATAKNLYGLAELELEHMVLFFSGMLQMASPRARKNPPELLIHKPTAVEA
jgi:hypothetical protein